MNSTTPQYRIVMRRPARQHWPVLRWCALWLSSLLVVAWLVHGVVAPDGHADARAQLPAPAVVNRAQKAELEQLRRRVAVLERSDRISRAANLDLQETLTQRETQIADLRADVAFYARLVGPTAQRVDLSVFSSRFTARDANAFEYHIVLTQTLNRGAISSGQMQFVLEGTRAGRPEVLDWTQLHAGKVAAPQDFSFRYFQELSGRVALPPGFTPQRVRVSLQAPGRPPVQRDFDWSMASR